MGKIEQIKRTPERLARVIKFMKECSNRKYTGKLEIHFSQGCPNDITRNETIKLEDE